MIYKVDHNLVITDIVFQHQTYHQCSHFNLLNIACYYYMVINYQKKNLYSKNICEHCCIHNRDIKSLFEGLLKYC